MGGEDVYKGRGVRRRRQRAGVGAVLVGLAAAASATIFVGGMQVGRVERELLDPVTGLDARCYACGRRHS